MQCYELGRDICGFTLMYRHCIMVLWCGCWFWDVKEWLCDTVLCILINQDGSCGRNVIYWKTSDSNTCLLPPVDYTYTDS